MFHGIGGATAGALDPGTAAAPEPAEEGLLFQRCRWCATGMFQRLLCPVCAGSDLRTEQSAGLGVVRHTSVAQRNTPCARNVSLVEMAEGFTVRGRVAGPLALIRTGDRVRLTMAKDPVRREPVFALCEEPFRGPYSRRH